MKKITFKQYAVIIWIVGMILGSWNWKGRFLWDDIGQIVQNRQVQTLAIAEAFKGGTFFDAVKNQFVAGAYYRPLLTVSFGLMYQLFGLNPVGYHVVQSGMYALNAVLLFGIFCKFMKHKTAAIMAGLYLVHPMNIENLAYIAAFNDTAGMALGLTALGILIYRPEKKGAFILVGGLILASWLFKESWILWAIVGGGYLYLYDRKNLLKLGMTMAAAGIVYMLLRGDVATLGNVVPADAPLRGWSLSERIWSIPAIVGFYLQTWLWPEKLQAAQMWVIAPGNWKNVLGNLSGLLGALGLGMGVTSKWVKDKKMAVWAGMWIIAGLAIHLQLVPLDFTVAEKWWYFPQIGLLLLAGVAGEKFLIKHPRWRMGVLGVVVIVGVALTGRSLIRIANWQTGEKLFGHDVAIDSNNYYLLTMYALELQTGGREVQAIPYYKKALELKQNNLPATFNLARIYENNENWPEAERYYEQFLNSMETDFTYASAMFVQLQNGHPLKALETGKTALSKYPENGKLWSLTAIALYRTGGQQEAALAAIEKAIALGDGAGANYVKAQILAGEEVVLVTKSEESR